MFLQIYVPLVLAMLLCLAAPRTSGAETYHWVDEQGNMHFSDNPVNLPRAARSKVQVREDITIRNPGWRAVVPESNNRTAEQTHTDEEQAHRKRLREAAEEQERKYYQARDKRLREMQAKLQEQEARELKRRMDTTPIQRSAEELGGFSVKGGST